MSKSWISNGRKFSHENGHLVKTALNEEGRQRNLKEAKLSKNLAPFVPEIQSISEDGSVMVCEDIQEVSSETYKNWGYDTNSNAVILN